MEQKDLKETMDQIHIQDEMQEDIIRNLYRPVKRNFFKKTGVLAAATLTAVIVIAVPVQAAIRHLIQERMDNLPAKEVEHLSQMQGSQEISADGFSRDYSPSEKKRMGELFKEYQNGNFPEGEILRVDSKDQVEENVFCYVEETGCFYFPDRELPGRQVE